MLSPTSTSVLLSIPLTRRLFIFSLSCRCKSTHFVRISTISRSGLCVGIYHNGQSDPNLFTVFYGCPNRLSIRCFMAFVCDFLADSLPGVFVIRKKSLPLRPQVGKGYEGSSDGGSVSSVG